MMNFHKAPLRAGFFIESYDWKDRMFFNEGLIRTYNPEFCICRFQNDFDRSMGINLIRLTDDRNVDSNRSYIFINYPDNGLTSKYFDGVCSKIELGMYKIGLIIHIDEGEDANVKNEESIDVVERIYSLTGMFVSKNKVLPCEDGCWLLVFNIEPKFSEREFELNKCDDIRFLYHLTKSSRVEKIMKMGLCPKSSNSEFDYPDRIYLGIDKNRLISDLLGRFKQLSGDAGYSILSIDIGKLPDKLKFNIDPNYPNGVFTTGNIPPEAISFDQKEAIDNG